MSSSEEDDVSVDSEMEQETPRVTITTGNESESEDDESDDSKMEQQVPTVKITTGVGSDTTSDSENGDEDMLVKNEGWADSIQKILSTTKPKNKKTLVLSRAKKHNEVKPVKEGLPFDVVEGPEDIKPDIKQETDIKEESKEGIKILRKRKERLSIRKKPNILEKDRERTLSKIATKGVVQLFNAVRNQQKSLQQSTEGNITEAKKEKILKSFDKKAFLDNLMGESKSVIVDKPKKEEPKWSALRDDFMLDAKLKDWDKINE